ncbi:MAG: chorismate mutase [Phyllobacteriaceae bacterium]|nr:chorismate mutase [Phyllobacteriaceae bacterium]
MAQTPPNPQRLTELRAKIDAVDESMHGLLMQRAGVIDELIRIKGADQAKGAAFRPGREAQMMRILAERHSGSVPLSMIVHVWREIISTFTWLQAPYRVHLVGGAEAATMRDMARFQFGFTVAIEEHGDAAGAMDAAIVEQNALVIVSLEGAGAWWDGLDSSGGLSVMARLPVADVPFPTVDAFVLSPPLSDPVPFDMRLYTGLVKSKNTLDQWTGGEVIRPGSASERALIAIPAGGSAPHDLLDIRAAGGYFAPAQAMDSSA